MDWIHQLLWRHNEFLGIHWGIWKAVGFVGSAMFSSRFLVQWYATEKLRRVSVPVSFWWLSLAGSLVMLCYGVFYLRDSVVILSYAFPWIPYMRNLIFHYRHEREQRTCPECGVTSPPTANFCSQCGARLTSEAALKIKA
jgi:lipid-A-disaccharide synthase-like uncharacterized protein